MEKELAAFILQMIGRSTMSCDDATWQNVNAAKQWLRAIVSGQLTVKPGKAPK